MNLADLEPRGHDSWDRPIFFNPTNKRWYCCVDLDATLDDVKEGKSALYVKCGDAEGEPDCPVRLLNVFEPPTPPGYLIKQDGMFAEWTAIRDNDLGEIIADGCETRAEAVRHAERDGGLPHTEKVSGKPFYVSAYLDKSGGFFSTDGTVKTATALVELEDDEAERVKCNDLLSKLLGWDRS